MRLLHRFSVLFLASAVSMSMAACGGDEGDDDEGVIVPEGDHHQYVVSEVILPKNASEGLDLDGKNGGDEDVDNNLGSLLAVLAMNAGATGLDLQENLTEQVQKGTILLLADVQATALTSANKVGMNVFLGSDPTPAACTDPAMQATCGKHLQGTGSFKVSSTSPAAADSLITGKIINGVFNGGPGKLTLQIALEDGTAPIRIDLVGARAKLTVSDKGLDGVVAGGLTQKSLDDAVFPGIATTVSGVMTRDCMLDKTAYPPCGCGVPLDEPKPPMVKTNAGKTIEGLFDVDHNCTVSALEVKTQKLLKDTFRLDVNLLGEEGAAPDALSLGVSVKAVNGTFTRP